LNLALIGLDKGIYQQKIALKIEEIEKVKVPIGVIDITLYRDDIGINESHQVQSEILPGLEQTIVLVDDVLLEGHKSR
jgi:pyrimidine operon attenuation protein/uracil phosphoribosyltransferase